LKKVKKSGCIGLTPGTAVPLQATLSKLLTCAQANSGPSAGREISSSSG